MTSGGTEAAESPIGDPGRPVHYMRLDVDIPAFWIVPALAIAVAGAVANDVLLVVVLTLAGATLALTAFYFGVVQYLVRRSPFPELPTRAVIAEATVRRAVGRVLAISYATSATALALPGIVPDAIASGIGSGIAAAYIGSMPAGAYLRRWQRQHRAALLVECSLRAVLLGPWSPVQRALEIEGPDSHDQHL